MRKRVLVIGGALALFTLSPATLAAAAPGPTGDEGLIGASNMKNSNALPGMTLAMSVDAAQGNAGMKCAVKITNGSWEPGSCP